MQQRQGYGLPIHEEVTPDNYCPVVSPKEHLAGLSSAKMDHIYRRNFPLPTEEPRFEIESATFDLACFLLEQTLADERMTRFR
jgi:hypothetical protein